MTELRVLSPDTVDEAVQLLQHEGAIAIGGGTSIAMMMKFGFLEPSTLVNLDRLPLAIQHRAADGSLTIGATITLRELAASTVLDDRDRALRTAAHVVGNPRVRAVATLGGALLHGDPRQDLPPALLALGGTVTMRSVQGEREVALADFFLGFMETACQENELVTQVKINADHDRSAYVRFNPASNHDYPVIAVAAALRINDLGRIAYARIAIAGAGSAAYVTEQAGELVLGEVPSVKLWRAAADAAMHSSDPTGDQRGSADYKREMVRVFTERALAKAIG
jgi:aerobic carbon-monoxide dehydrogenase medium subunit